MNRWSAIIGALALASGPGCGDDGNAQDVPGDQGRDVADVPDTSEDDGTADAEDAVEDAPPEEDVGPEDTTEVPTDGPPDDPPDVPGVCGNGLVGGSEVCDDGNTVNEACDTTSATACLGDCSLLVSDCGNGTLDPGEQCDDGDDDSFDDCTTSCTINDQNIGAPCRCASGCSDLNLTLGTIVGCDHVAVPGDGSATLACLRGVDSPTFGIQAYAAEGFCGLMAMSCTDSPFICGFVPVTGDVDAFECPLGYLETTDVRVVSGATVTTKLCGLPCTSHADCRWAARDTEGPWAGICGEWQCTESATGEFVCSDPRNDA